MTTSQQPRGKLYYSPNTFQSYGDQEMDSVLDWLKNNKLDDQKIIEKFENKIAEIFQAKHGIFVNSGSSANLLACLAAGIGPGKEVITPTCTFPTTLSPIIFLGATPVFCDIDNRRYVPSVEQVMKLVTPKTYAVLIPHLVGDLFDFPLLSEELKKIGRSDVILIEDACDTICKCNADYTTVSFYASHVISAGGCGGMVIVNDDSTYQKCLELRNKGPWDLTAPGFCAAFGLANAEKFPTFAQARNKHIKHYLQRLEGKCDFYETPKCTDSVFLSMPLVCKKNRYQVVEALEARGIQTRLCMAGNILRQPFYARLFPDVDPSSFPETEKVFEGGILLGAHQGLSDEDVDWICDQLIEIAKEFDHD